MSAYRRLHLREKWGEGVSMIRRGCIIFEDAHKHRFTIVIQGITSMSALQDCVDTLRGKSDAAIISCAYTEEQLFTDGECGSGAYDCTKQQLQLSYVTDASPITFYLPAPKEAIVDAHQEATAQIVAQIKSMLESNTTATGLTSRGGALIASPK